MIRLVFWLEEYSAQVLLEGLIPRLFVGEQLPANLNLEYHCFNGKSDLERNICRKIHKYYSPDNLQVAHLILRDQDAGDCKQVKQKLLNMVSDVDDIMVLVRIACHELESFYLADLAAVETALQISNLARRQNHATYRNPDTKNSSADLLDKLTAGKYQKVSGSRAIGKVLDIKNQRSPSFSHLVEAIQKLLVACGVSVELFC
ncbi:MAG: DUF4276 family protein [Burkholderiales bacterium]|nr:DUF4276 family protein [Burkholderiales bacterium]